MKFSQMTDAQLAQAEARSSAKVARIRKVMDSRKFSAVGIFMDSRGKFVVSGTVSNLRRPEDAPAALVEGVYQTTDLSLERAASMLAGVFVVQCGAGKQHNAVDIPDKKGLLEAARAIADGRR